MPQDDASGLQTDEERRAFRQALAARRERLTIAGRVFALALFGLVAAAIVLRLPETWWVPAVGFVAIAGLLFRLANWKCPACGERLPTRGASRCRGCGAVIEDE
jgi:fatty acid desaturase